MNHLSPSTIHMLPITHTVHIPIVNETFCREIDRDCRKSISRVHSQHFVPINSTLFTLLTPVAINTIDCWAHDHDDDDDGDDDM